MENFDLQIATIDGDTRRFRVAVRSPAGEARPEEVVLPPWPKDPGDLDALAAERLGAALWDAAFPPSFRLRWERSLGTTGGELRLRICTEEGDVATTSVPWELLYDADGAGFLALHSGTPVVRYLEGPDDGAQPYRPGTLRLLLSGASPTGMESLLVSAQHNA